MEKNLTHHASLLQFVYAMHTCSAYEYPVPDDINTIRDDIQTCHDEYVQ